MGVTKPLNQNPIHIDQLHGLLADYHAKCEEAYAMYVKGTYGPTQRVQKSADAGAHLVAMIEAQIRKSK